MTLHDSPPKSRRASAWMTLLVSLLVPACADTGGSAAEGESGGLTLSGDGEAGDSGGDGGFDKVDDLDAAVYRVLSYVENPDGCEVSGTPAEDAPEFVYVAHHLQYANGNAEGGATAQGELCGMDQECLLGLQCDGDSDTCEPCQEDLDCAHTNNCDEGTGLCQDRMTMGVFACPDEVTCALQLSAGAEAGDYTQYMLGGDRVENGAIVGRRGQQEVDGQGNCRGGIGVDRTTATNSGFAASEEHLAMTDWVPCEDLEAYLSAAPCESSEHLVVERLDD